MAETMLGETLGPQVFIGLVEKGVDLRMLADLVQRDQRRNLSSSFS